MRKIAIIRVVLWGFVAIVAGATVALAINWYRTDAGGRNAALSPPSTAIGGPFTLTDTSGNKVSDTDFKGKPRAMFFGYTYCPDVCPTTLVEIDGWMEALGRDADKLVPIYVTVDPERDTVEQMRWFLSSFDKRIVGLTGTQAELDPVLDSFRVYRKKTKLEDDGDYVMDHTASVYLMNGDGQFVGTISYQEDKEKAMAKLRRLIADS